MQFTPKFEVTGDATDQKWLGSAHATTNARSITIDGATLTAFNNVVPAGTPITETEGGKFAPATSTSDTLAGFLLVDQPYTGTGDLIAQLLDHGRIRVNYLPDGAPDVTSMPANPHFILVKEA